MLLRITYSNTKRFLKRTIQRFKFSFAGGYQRLPKTPPCNPFSCKETGSMKVREPNLIINYDHYEVDSKNQQNKLNDHGKDEDEDEDESSKCLVTRKLKELEMMDQTNVDLLVDIEEVLHYYSRLTCPVYRDIIDKFFLDMYSGTFNLSRLENSVSAKRFG